MVALDNQVRAMGRYPNTDAPDGGYLTYNAHSGKTSITDNGGLAAGIDWTGAHAVVHPQRWVLDHTTIASQVGRTLTFATPISIEPVNNYGYFIQNDMRTHDKPGEW